MRKFYTLFFFCLLALESIQSQTVTITGTGTSSSYIYGPVYTFGTTAARYFRAAYIYPSSLLTSMPSGATVQSLAFERTGTAALTGGSNFKIYLANTTATDWGTASLPWDVTGATLVYDSDPTSVVDNSAGWKIFTVTPSFIYTGNNLAVFVEYSQPAGTGSATTINWNYQSSSGQPAYVANSTKYSSSTSALPASMASGTTNHPHLEITFTTGSCTNPATPGNAQSDMPFIGICQGNDVLLSLINHSTGAGTLYKWQSSSSQTGPYADVSSFGTSSVLTVNPTTTTWYQAVVKCDVSGTERISTPVEVVVNGPLPAGTYTINNLQPTSGSNFQSFKDAIDRINCGVTGHVFFDVSAGQSFSSVSDIIFQGSSSGTVTFRKAGAGANPKIVRTGSAGTTDYILKLSGADYLTFDAIDFEQTGTSTSDFVEYGLFIVNASATNGSQNNTFKNGTISLGHVSSSARGVFMDDIITPTAQSGTNSFNKFLNMKVQNAFAGYYLTGATANFQDEGNQITTEGGGSSQITLLGNGTTSGTVYGVYGTYQSNLLVSNTDIGPLTGGSTSSVYGSYFPTSAGMSIIYTNNHVHDLTSGGVVSGFFQGAGISLTASNNHIHAIRTNNAASSAVRGMDIDGSTGYIANVFNNRIYDLSSAGLTGTTVVGIELTIGDEFNVHNNMISDLRAPSSTSTTGGVKGIGVATATAGAVVRLYYNTIYLNDVAGVAAYANAGIYSSSAVPVLDLRNNLVLNKSDVSAGTRAVAFWSANTTLNLHIESDNNLYYAGTPGPKNLIYFNGTAAIEQLDDYKLQSGMSPREENSRTENTVLLPVTAGIVRIDPNTQSLAESGGQEIAGYTSDFEGTQRGPYPMNGQTNGAGTNPDIGADEYDGRTTDIVGPTINFTLLGNTSSTANRTLTVTITDPSGVRTGTDGPRLYYRKSGSTLYVFDSNPTISGDEYTFTIDYAAIGGVVGGNLIEYYVAAQDMNGYSSTSPFGGSGSNPPGTNAPATPVSYLILYSLNGVYTVGPSGNQLNLTAISNLLKNGTAEVVGHTIFELQADYDGTSGETFPIQFNQFATNNPNWTVTIRPAAGVTARVTSGDPGSSNPVINLNGVDRMIFDGRPGGVGTVSEWTIRNTRTATTIASVFRLIDDAANDTLRFLTLESQATSTSYGLVHISTSASGTMGNSYNVIANNILRGRTDGTPTTVSTGVYAAGTTAVPNINNSITGNHIVNTNNYGVYMSGNGNGAGWVISGNHIYGDMTTSTTKYPIYLTSDSSKNLQVTNNFIGGNAANATGLMAVDGNVIFTGINITGGVAKIVGNTIGNVTNTNTGTAVRVRGIYNTSDQDSVEIKSNTIFNLASHGGITGLGAGSQTVAGISVWPGSTFYYITVTDNIVYNLSAENTSALTTSNMAAGIFLTNFKGIMARNKIYNITNKSTGTTAGQPPIAAGIYSRFLDDGYVVNNMIAIGQNETNNVQYNGIMINANGGGNNHYYYYNTVLVGGTSAGDFSSFAFLRGDNSTTTAVQGVDVRNNIFYMLRSGGATANYAIGNQGTTPETEWATNYNNYYNTDNTRIGFWNATGYDLAGWQTISSQDANSKSIAVNFINPLVADFHLTGGSVGDVRLGGIPIAVVDTDFDLQARNSLRPYMGADEGAVGLPVYLEYFKGERQNNVHVLNWKGHCTGNNNVFTVERSADGRSFTAVGELSASQVDCQLPFSLVDKSPLAGINYYRLRIRDENGRISYSITIAILNKETGFEVVSVFPTPTKNKLYVNVASTHKANLSLSIVDVHGRMVRQAAKEVQQGTGLITLDVNNLAAGMYILQCRTAEGYEKTIRFVKE